MNYVSNAFSLGMLPLGSTKECDVLELDSRPDLTGYTSVVGHADTAVILGLDFNRQTVKLAAGDVLIVAQYDGPRLPEGSTKLPDGASFRWFQVRL